MAKGVYVGISNVAKKIKKIYVGIGGVAKKVKKAYVGVGGVAKLFYAPNLVLQSTSVDSLRASGDLFGTASNSNYAIFSFVKSNTKLTAYNSSLTQTAPTSVSKGRERPTSVTVGDYCLFAGGYNSGLPSDVNAYNASLTLTNPTGLTTGRTGGTASSNPSYALVAGTNTTLEIDAYNTSLTKTLPTTLSEYRDQMGSGDFSYAFLAGGAVNSWYSKVDVYDTSLTKSNPASLSSARKTAGAALENYIVFCGGKTSNSSSSVVSDVEAYSKSLVKTSLASLNKARFKRCMNFKDKKHIIVFADNGYSFDMYDSSLTRSIPALKSTLSYETSTWSSSACIGNYVLGSNGYGSTVNAFSLSEE